MDYVPDAEGREALGGPVEEEQLHKVLLQPQPSPLPIQMRQKAGNWKGRGSVGRLFGSQEKPSWHREGSESQTRARQVGRPCSRSASLSRAWQGGEERGVAEDGEGAEDGEAGDEEEAGEGVVGAGGEPTQLDGAGRHELGIGLPHLLHPHFLQDDV